MSFVGQVIALVRKDWRVFSANRKSSTLEVMFPIMMGLMTGLFILLVQLIESGFGEFDNVDTTFPFWTFLPETIWFGIAGAAREASTVALALSRFLHLNTSVPAFDFDNATAMLDAYAVASSSSGTSYSTFLGLNATGPTSFELYGQFSNDSMWSTAFSLGALMTSPNAAYPQRVVRNADHEDLVSMPNLRAIFSSTGCMLLTYAFIPSLILTAGRLVEEKRVKARESLKVMGLSDSAYLVSNFISSMLRMAIGTGLISLCLAAFGVVSGSDIPIVFAMGLLFACSLIAFAQIMPSLFSVSIWSNVLCIVLLSGGAAISSLSTGWPLNVEVLVCLLSPVAFYYGLLPYMANGTVTLALSPHGAIAMLALDVVLYVLIGNYLYAINPGEFGVPKHPLFFVRWIWASDKDKKRGNGNGVSPTVPAPGSSSSGATAADRVVLRDLVKVYGTNHDAPAVDKLTLSIRHSECLSILGHNGAGKTTTISILTGMITATDYAHATVDGRDIGTQMDAIRATVGLCPQFDVLFADLTARQHLELFAEIKGIVPGAAAARIAELLQGLELPDTAQRASTFSGGTKRRLSVGNALVGDATLLYLDEPSSGLDPLSRRRMWDLLKAEKAKGKTIILTTHYLEEADYLGDRIAIMSRGRLYCCDTAQQLKERYGCGYYLTLVKRSAHGDDSEPGSKAASPTAAHAQAPNVDEAFALVTRHVPDATRHHESSGEAQFLLPIAALPRFAELLADVERRLPELGFHSYGLAMNTLEDVFVAISEAEEALKDAGRLKKQHGQAAPAAAAATAAAALSLDDTKLPNGETPEQVFQRAAHVSNSARLWSQIGTVFWRKWTMLKRTRRMQLMIVLFPLFFIIVGFLVLQPQAVNQRKYQGEALPDFNHLYIINLCLRDEADNALVLKEFRAIYAAAYPNSTLTVYPVTSMSEYGSGRYVPMHSVSYAEGFKSPDITMGFLAHHLDLAATPPVANYTFIFNKKFAATLATQMIAWYNTALERAAGNGAAPALTITSERFPASESATPQPTEPNQQGGGKTTTYNFMQVGIYIVISVVQLVANCAIPVADEMQRLVFHTSRIQGMSVAAYFLGNLLFDFCCCLFPFAVMLAMIFIKGIGAFFGAVTLVVIAAGFLFAVHVVLQAYVLVTYVEGLRPVTYTGILHGANLAMLGFPYLFETVLNAAGFAYYHDVKPFILSFTPPCCFYHILDNTSDLTADNTSASYILTFTGIATAWGLVFLVVELAVPVFLLYAFATGRSLLSFLRGGGGGASPRADQRTLASGGSSAYGTVGINHESVPLIGVPADECAVQAAGPPEDADVRAERLRVRGAVDDNMVAALGLRKDFGLKTAVNDVSFGILPGECVGLLGPNAAGKSTTVNLLLRHIAPTRGNIVFPFAGHADSATPIDELFRAARLGVCMQGDTLWDFLSAAEHMDQFLRLRLTTAYDPAQWSAFIERAVNKVYLADAGSRTAGGYSGGMKRKLQVCLAVFTGAVAIFADEPSTGMDAFSRRALWAIILEALSRKRCVLLTTHSMEEADAVCSRIAIITAGSLRCIGSSQHLKNRFGSGYVLVLVHDEARPDAAARIDAALLAHFGHAEVQEVLGRQRRYGLGRLSSLAQAFRFVESQREALGLLQYSISQTVSLEQIFLAFVGTADPGAPAIGVVQH